MDESLQVSIRRLDGDTALISVRGEAPLQPCAGLDAALGQAESLGTPGLIIDLSDLANVNEPVVSTVTEFQKRCIGHGRWLLVVPPCSTLGEYLLNLV